MRTTGEKKKQSGKGGPREPKKRQNEMRSEKKRGTSQEWPRTAPLSLVSSHLTTTCLMTQYWKGTCCLLRSQPVMVSSWGKGRRPAIGGRRHVPLEERASVGRGGGWFVIMDFRFGGGNEKKGRGRRQEGSATTRSYASEAVACP